MCFDSTSERTAAVKMPVWPRVACQSGLLLKGNRSFLDMVST